MNIKWFKKQEPSKELLRKQLGGIDLDFLAEQNIEANLDENDKKALYTKAHLIYKNPIFRKVRQHLINAQANYIIRNARTEQELFFGRATINGIELFWEEIERLNGLYEEQNQAKVKYDKYNLI